MRWGLFTTALYGGRLLSFFSLIKYGRPSEGRQIKWYYHARWKRGEEQGGGSYQVDNGRCVVGNRRWRDCCVTRHSVDVPVCLSLASPPPYFSSSPFNLAQKITPLLSSLPWGLGFDPDRALFLPLFHLLFSFFQFSNRRYYKNEVENPSLD